MDPQLDAVAESKSKAPVIRGARACTVCRAAKMKCVGSDDGQKRCQRCNRANVECIFEKHRRGRKPGSKLSEASKMLRRLEKGLNTAKLKSQPSENTSPFSHEDIRSSAAQETSYSTMRPVDPAYPPPNPHYSANEVPPPQMPAYPPVEGYPASSNPPRGSIDMDEDEDDADRNDEALFPAKLIKRENQRNSFFRTILNPESTPATTPLRSNSFTPPQQMASAPSPLSDPITAGIITEDDAKTLFDALFLRLNPFINLFDPALHTVSYVRSKCPFLFTTLIMAGCKFFKTEKFKQCQKLANEFAVRAFAENWKRVEVIQAFACLTYWKDPDDTRTWMYIGYACRMAVELGLNRYVAIPPASETDFQRLERRNRERTYLVLFVHDRSLSMQTGRSWMLPEDDLVRHSGTWHQTAGQMRPEDVIIAAFVALRRIAAESTDVFNAAKVTMSNNNTDINYEVLLTNCNTRLTQWDDTWRHEMNRACGEKFHFSFLTFFRLHVRLFLNSFGIQASLHHLNRQPSLQAMSSCCNSALDSLRIVSQDFHQMHVLRYGQDSITVMTAYSAVFLLRLLRMASHQLPGETIDEIYTLITQTADSYQEASTSPHAPVSISASYHARFLRSLVMANDVFKMKRNERDRHDGGVPIDPRLQGPPNPASHVQNPAQVYAQRTHEQTFHFPASPHLPAHPQSAMQEADYQVDFQGRNMGNAVQAPVHYSSGNYPQGVPNHASELDAHYWKNMFLELGFGDNGDPGMPPLAPTALQRSMAPPQYMDNQQPQGPHPHQGHSSISHPHGMQNQGPMHYSPMHSSHQNYGH